MLVAQLLLVVDEVLEAEDALLDVVEIDDVDSTWSLRWCEYWIIVVEVAEADVLLVDVEPALVDDDVALEDDVEVELLVVPLPAATCC